MRIVITAVALAAALAVAGSAQASSITQCGSLLVAHGSPAGITNLTTRSVSCSYARRFATQVTARYPFPRQWRGFACRSYSYDQQHAFDIRCVRQAEVIHWQGGD